MRMSTCKNVYTTTMTREEKTFPEGFYWGEKCEEHFARLTESFCECMRCKSSREWTASVRGTAL